METFNPHEHRGHVCSTTRGLGGGEDGQVSPNLGTGIEHANPAGRQGQICAKP